MDNVSRVVDGVSWGCRAVDAIQYWNGRWELAGQSSWRVFDRVPINVSVTLITDWAAYRVLVEYASDVIVVNCHGEVLPVPSGYNASGWVGVVADAMLHRRVSWVHVGGYPFYRVWYQGASGSVEWPVDGTLGFKSLMAHINLPDVECWPAVNEHERIYVHSDAEALLGSWGVGVLVNSVENGRPLKNSDFGDYFVMRVHGGVEYFSCAVVAFAKPNQRFNVTEEYGFGAYVHVGTNQTYDYAGASTDKDYWRGYVGAAAATWTSAMSHTAENDIVDAEASITRAQSEGRTKGLDKAITLLNMAKEKYRLYHFSGGENTTIVLAGKSMEAADAATSPSFFESYSYHIIGLGILCAVVAGFGIRKRNGKHKPCDHE